ncbi:DUF6891 domain-containing protein [Nonomuraea sediminis]|uniref:DUF6891 domain-containing protein n=1 Tax=Nonomuraea sediminis TaxID=2835864 RepID=UPI001BDDC9B6|nr:hypothetical protein [Nonomuraea sediminis]
MIDENGLRERVRLLLALGEDDFDGIVEQGTEYLEGAPGAGSLARDVAVQEFAGYLDGQRAWPEVLDSDRLLRAFRDLDLAGIVARVDFACCQSCGISEIGGEVPESERDAYRGYVFCHRQDMAAAVQGGGLFLAYGIFTDADRAADQAEIGAEVAAAIRGRGLEVDWNGDPGTRIGVPLTWRRRRFGRLAGRPGGPAPAAPGPERLAVTYCDYRRGRGVDEPVAMSLAEARTVLLDLTPVADNFAVFEGPSGGVVQMCWEQGRRLWLETLDQANRCSYGRHVTPDEAHDLVTVLAREDRVAVDRLGELETRRWD